MQNEDKNEVAAAAPVPEVMPVPVASEGAPAAEKRMPKWKEWWHQRSAFEKEFCCCPVPIFRIEYYNARNKLPKG